MARVTVEDCLDHVDNRFELVLLASKRARQLTAGKEATLEWENDKPTVMALREISEGNITVKILKEMAEAEKRAREAAEVEAAMEQQDSEEPSV